MRCVFSSVVFFAISLNTLGCFCWLWLPEMFKHNRSLAQRSRGEERVRKPNSRSPLAQSVRCNCWLRQCKRSLLLCSKLVAQCAQGLRLNCIAQTIWVKWICSFIYIFSLDPTETIITKKEWSIVALLRLSSTPLQLNLVNANMTMEISEVAGLTTTQLVGG